MAEMRVAVLQKDRSLVVEKVPVPELLPRTAIVKLQAVFLSPFTANVFSGNLLHNLRVSKASLSNQSQLALALTIPLGRLASADLLKSGMHDTSTVLTNLRG